VLIKVLVSARRSVGAIRVGKVHFGSYFIPIRIRVPSLKNDVMGTKINRNADIRIYDNTDI